MNSMNACLKREFQVVLLGANSCFGKITSFLLKQCPKLNKLTLYDDKSIQITNDIEFINTACKLSFVNGRENISDAIKTADIIIIGDGSSKAMTHESVFLTRIPLLSDYVQLIACHNSNAIVVVATSPVNMTFPLVSESLKNLGKWHEKRFLGLTNVENITARCILANHLHINPRSINFPVIGGSSSETRVPLLSKICPYVPLTKPDLQKITCAVKTYETKVYTAAGNQESLKRAYATSMLVQSIIAALNGQEVLETVLSHQNIVKDTEYFSLPVILGKEGIKQHLSFSDISQNEKSLLSHAAKCMAADTRKAKHYSDKIKEQLIKAVHQSTLNTVTKKYEEKNCKIQIPQLQYIPFDKEFNDIIVPSTTNLKRNNQLKLPEKPLVSAMKENSTICHKNHNNDNIISSNSSSKSVMVEDKLFDTNEVITSEIDVTLGVNDSKLNLSNTSPAFQELTDCHSEVKDVNDVQENVMCTECDIEKQPDISKKSIQLQHNNRDTIYPLSISSATNNKLIENSPTKNISEANSVSGLENCKSLKRYHRVVSDDRKETKSYCNNMHVDKISLLQLCKEQMGSFSFEVPNNESISLSTNTNLCSNNDNKSKCEKEISDKSVRPNISNIDYLRRISTAEYLTLNNTKHPELIFLPWKNVQNFYFNNRKNILVLLDPPNKQKNKLTKLMNIKEKFDEKFKPAFISRLDRISTTPHSFAFPLDMLPKNKDVNTKKKINQHLDLFQTNCDVENLNMIVKIPKQFNKESTTLSDSNITGSTNSLHINKPHLILHSELFKSDKYQKKQPVTEWSRYASSESHEKQIGNNEINNKVGNKEQNQESLLFNPQHNQEIKQDCSVTSMHNTNYKQQLEKTPTIKASQIPEKLSFNATFTKNIVPGRKSNDDFCFDNVLYKQKNVISSGVTHTSFKKQEYKDSVSSPQKKLKKLERDGIKYSHDRQLKSFAKKIHLLKSNSVYDEGSVISSAITKSEESKAMARDNNWKQKYFQKTKINTLENTKAGNEDTIQKASKSTEKNEYHSLKKENDYKVPEIHKVNFEKSKCSQVINNNSNHNHNDGALSNETISKPFMKMQKQALSEKREIKTEGSLPSIYDNYSCKSLINVPSDNGNSETCIRLGHLLQHPSLTSETNDQNIEIVKKNENSLKIHDLEVKESKNNS